MHGIKCGHPHHAAAAAAAAAGGIANKTVFHTCMETGCWGHSSGVMRLSTCVVAERSLLLLLLLLLLLVLLACLPAFAGCFWLGVLPVVICFCDCC